MNENERNEKEATDKASEAAASLSQFAAKPIKVMSSCRGRLYAQDEDEEDVALP